MKKITELTAELAAPAIAEQGCTLWDVEYVKEAGSWYLRVYIDKDTGVSIDDCEAVSRVLSDLLDEVSVGKPKTKDFKTSLQERSVALFHDRPVYTTLACEGPEHARHFTVQVSLPSGQQFTATGTSCKKAEQEAARLALELMGY